jgi:hypothetical protein
MFGHGCDPFWWAGGAGFGVVWVADGVVDVDEPPDVAAWATTAVPPARAPVTATATRVSLRRFGIAFTSFWLVCAVHVLHPTRGWYRAEKGLGLTTR